MDKARWVIKVSSKTGEKYDSEALNELCSGIDLLEYASNSMDFVKRGADSFAAHCPLHIDETASLFITPSKNMFHCFSCGVSGNIINWLRTFEGLNFHEAVDKVSSLAGVNINHFKQCESLAYYKSVYKSLQKTQKKQEPVHRKILEPSYMNQFSNEIPQEWVDEGIHPDVMREFGVRIDKMSNRIVYPVYDNDLNLIGVKGRTRFKNYADLKIKKYQNYQSIGTTDYFAGMKENRESIIQSGSAIIFEGIKSVMKLRGWGWNTALAADVKVIMIENGTYADLVNGNYGTKYNNKSFWASYHSLWHKYNVPIIFMPDKSFSGFFIRGFFTYYLKNCMK